MRAHAHGDHTRRSRPDKSVCVRACVRARACACACALVCAQYYPDPLFRFAFLVLSFLAVVMLIVVNMAVVLVVTIINKTLAGLLGIPQLGVMLSANLQVPRTRISAHHLPTPPSPLTPPVVSLPHPSSLPHSPAILPSMRDEDRRVDKWMESGLLGTHARTAARMFIKILSSYVRNMT